MFQHCTYLVNKTVFFVSRLILNDFFFNFGSLIARNRIYISIVYSSLQNFCYVDMICYYMLFCI